MYVAWSITKIHLVFCREGDELIFAWSLQWRDLVTGKAQAGDAFISRVALFFHEDNIGEKKSLSWDNIKAMCLTLLVCPLSQIHRDALVSLFLRRQFPVLHTSSHLCLTAAFPSILCCSCNSWTQRIRSYGLHTAHILFTSVYMLCRNTLNIYKYFLSVQQHPPITLAFHDFLNTNFLYSFFIFFSSPIPQIVMEN